MDVVMTVIESVLMTNRECVVMCEVERRGDE